MADKKDKKSLGARAVKYFKDVKGEMKKVVWPTFKQVKNNTIIVLIAIILVGILIWVLDFAFAKTLGTVVEKYGNQTAPSNSVNFDTSADTSLPEGVDVVTDEDLAEDAETEEAAAEEEGADAEAETAEDAADAGADSDGE